MDDSHKLFDLCFLSVLTDDVIEQCEPFTCGNDEDMDEFFRTDAIAYAKFRMGKSYCFRLTQNPKKIVACFTVSNDSIRLYDLGSSKKNKMWKDFSNREKRLSRYPGILIGRLAVAKEFAGQGFGSEVVRFIKEWFVVEDNKSGCRLAIVDAKNDAKVLAFYERNGFSYLFQTERDEFRYMNLSKSEQAPSSQNSPLSTRLMYCDLLLE